jgi:DNA-binding Lrp family transcriptional regulator
VLRLVTERPGITVPELGRELSVDPTGLYQIVRRLESRGELRKIGPRLEPVAAVGAVPASVTPADVVPPPQPSPPPAA